MKVKPLGENVLVKPIEEKATASGIVLPESAKEKPQEGEVVAVGSGKLVDGKKVALEVKVGDKVYFEKYGPKEIKIDNKEYYLISESDILAILE